MESSARLARGSVRRGDLAEAEGPAVLGEPREALRPREVGSRPEEGVERRCGHPLIGQRRDVGSQRVQSRAQGRRALGRRRVARALG